MDPDPAWERFEARARAGAWIVAAAVVVIAFVTRWRPGCLSPPDGPAERTAMQLKQLAYEAFPSWLASHPDRRCPTSLADLAEFASRPQMIDPWGWHLVARCERPSRWDVQTNLGEGFVQLVIGSPGPDGMFGSDDDVWSDEGPHSLLGIFE